MNMTGLIEKKKTGAELSGPEIDFIISGFTSGDIPDYQMSAMLMAICFTGMSSAETLALTMAMLNSGDRLDLSRISGKKADKHSTGGVGDKTSLALCPMVAAAGVKMAKLSGRGLGHTGGTIDKLESIPGFISAMEPEKFFGDIEKIGFTIASQSAGLAPADKKLYALRDVTGTVDSRPLIVSSIMSKKLAAGADVIVLDVKTGSGGFMRTEEDAVMLARELVDIGRGAGKRAAALITGMDQPLGRAIGNSLEVIEAIETLKGNEKGDLLELCLKLGACILTESSVAQSETEAVQVLTDSITTGAALSKFAEFVSARGADERAIYDTSIFPRAAHIEELISPCDGYVSRLDARRAGDACRLLGGGRENMNSVIDHSAGVSLERKIGEQTKKGEPLAFLHGGDRAKIRAARETLLTAYEFSDGKPEARPLIRGVVR